MSSNGALDFHAIADRLNFSADAFIDGKRSPALSGQVMENVNPATGQVIGTVARCQGSDIDAAVLAARHAFRSGVWSRVAPEQRKAVLLRLADLIRQNSEELAVLESVDSGKPIKDCLHEIGTEVPLTFQWYAELIDKTFGKVGATDESALALIVREPVGVAGLVVPWNFPLLMATWKLAPALASGCSTVVKPAEQTSLSTVRLAELATEAGVPPGVINVVPGLGEEAGKAIGLHPDIDVVSFTGSVEVGRHFLRYSGDSNLKPIGLELGGKSPFIVLDDAVIDDAMIESAISAAFWNGGQNCSANMRQIVHARARDEFLHRVVERAKLINLGDPLDPETEMGPLITKEHRDRVAGFIASGKAAGAPVAAEFSDVAQGLDGWYLGPTIFADMTRDMEIARDEIFGPVLGIIGAETSDQALDIANDSEYGLHATIFTKDIDKAFRLARRLACGTVAINGFTEGDIKTPFGGYKRSGSLSRDKGTEALEQYLQTKTIWLSLA